jgi:hypothetical protein
MRIAIALMLMATVLGSCKKKEADKPVAAEPAAIVPADPAPAAAPDPAPATAVEPAAAGDADKMSKRGGNCPSMVAGATTVASADASAVTLTVSASDADAISSIQRRSTELLAEKQDPAAGGTHDQKGTYGGSLGLCPVVTKGATVAMTKTEKGVAMTLTPIAGTTVQQLKTLVDERIKLSVDYVAANIKPGEDIGNGGAVGGGKGDHGSNHTGKGDGKGKDAEAAKAKAKVKGSGEGTGGGDRKGTGSGDGGKMSDPAK